MAQPPPPSHPPSPTVIFLHSRSSAPRPSPPRSAKRAAPPAAPPPRHTALRPAGPPPAPAPRPAAATPKRAPSRSGSTRGAWRARASARARGVRWRSGRGCGARRGAEQGSCSRGRAGGARRARVRCARRRGRGGGWPGSSAWARRLPFAERVGEACPGREGGAGAWVRRVEETLGPGEGGRLVGRCGEWMARAWLRRCSSRIVEMTMWSLLSTARRCARDCGTCLCMQVE